MDIKKIERDTKIKALQNLLTESIQRLAVTKVLIEKDELLISRRKLVPSPLSLKNGKPVMMETNNKKNLEADLSRLESQKEEFETIIKVAKEKIAKLSEENG